MGIARTERGFTFLTLLLTVTILFMTLPFISYLIKSAAYSTNYQEESIQQFLYFLRDDVIKATDYAVTPTAIKLIINDEETVTIEQYETLIRRQVNGQGHEIYLRDVEEVSFTSLPYGIHAKITSIQGETYEKQIIIYQ
ncbi:ComGF family competence protein [Lentibacillus sp. Marseille-P4043]|uniref:ComGF family competence protein n=1 Tax=Lentibacillus sp. Marseille-P4043 TaxID=2040293 RepID=UPI00131A5C9E|nr:ComGF family competence protein [Lentibacillus sp. Marseille-P4043]